MSLRSNFYYIINLSKYSGFFSTGLTSYTIGKYNLFSANWSKFENFFLRRDQKFLILECPSFVPVSQRLSLFLKIERLSFFTLKSLTVSLILQGSGYRVFSFGALTLQFYMSYSHCLYYQIKPFTYFNLKATPINIKFNLAGFTYDSLLNLGHSFKKIQLLNIYTGRGLYFFNERIVRKLTKRKKSK